MKKMMWLVFVMMGCSALYAESKAEYAPKMVIGDGKNGNVWGQWSQTVKEASVKEVHVHLHRVKGSENTYVNLRFGKKGQALDGAKRVYLKDTKAVWVRWNVGNTAPGGKPLILNAYDGEVKVNKVVVVNP